MAAVTRDYITVPGAEVDIERLFNKEQDLFGLWRWSLSSETVRKLLYWRILSANNTCIVISYYQQWTHYPWKNRMSMKSTNYYSLEYDTGLRKVPDAIRCHWSDVFEREMQSLSRLILLHGRNNLIYHAENAWYLKNLQLLQYGIFYVPEKLKVCI